MNLIASASTSENFVHLTPSATAWVVLALAIAVLVSFDLWKHRKGEIPSTRSVIVESLGYVVVGVAFGVGVGAVYGSAAFTEYISGYVLEKSLSVDNVFAWSLVFSAFAVPVRYQRRVLFWGIFGALLLRAIFVFAGAAVVSRFSIAVVIFGAFLVYSGAKVLRHNEDEESDAGHERAGKILGRFMPVSETFDGQRFFTRLNGVRAATPLLAALVMVELVDIVFAVDSVPAILAVSRTPYLVLASNAFAILGLRSLYFLLAQAKERFHYLSHALGVVLLFVGVKMIASIKFHIPTPLSLSIIGVLLVAGIVASMLRTTDDDHTSESNQLSQR